MVHDPKGGAARTAVIAQSPEVKTTKSTQPRSHGKQANTKLHSHDTPTICPSDPATPRIKDDSLVN
jgi:hypothetical protein